MESMLKFDADVVVDVVVVLVLRLWFSIRLLV